MKAWRCLSKLHGVTPPPDAEMMRLCFGQEREYRLDKTGITILGVRYQSEAAQQHFRHENPEKVSVRWHPKDIGAISVTAARDLIDVVKHAVPVTRLPNMLGASRPLVALLIEIGQLQRVQDHRALASKISKAVDDRGVKPILRFLEASFQAVDEAPEGFVHLSKSVEKSRAGVKFILELMFLGHLKRVCRVTGAHGFAAVVVDPEEIKALLEYPPSGLSEDSYFLMG